MTQPKLFFSLRTVDKPEADKLQKQLRDLLPDIPYEDLSLRVEDSDNWKELASTLIKSADAVICVVGETTHSSEPIEWEIREALAHARPLFVTALSEKFKLPSAAKETSLPITKWDVVGLASTIGELLINKTLFNSIDDSKGVLIQYGIMVSSWESLINRRQSVNQIYLGACAAVLTAIGTLVALSKNVSGINITSGAMILATLGIFLSFNWRQTITSYGILSTAKSKVIAAMEEVLPARLFAAEWSVLQRRAYQSTTGTDKRTSTVFLVLFGLIFLASMLLGFDILS